MQHRLLSNILKRRSDRHRVLKLMLFDKVISRENKNIKRKKKTILDLPSTYKAMVASIFQWWSGSWWMERKLSIVKAVVPWRTSPVHQQKYNKISKTYFCIDASCCYNVLSFWRRTINKNCKCIWNC